MKSNLLSAHLVLVLVICSPFLLEAASAFHIPTCTSRRGFPLVHVSSPSSSASSEARKLPVCFSSAPQQNSFGSDNINGASTTANSFMKSRRAIGLLAWLLSISIFIVLNVKGDDPFPSALLESLSASQWSLIHALSSMMFGGTIILSTLIEYLVVSSKKASILKWWFLTVPSLDGFVVLPALTGSIVSGVGQALYNYGGLADAPKHVVGAVHSLVLFGLWWGLTDVTTQHKAETIVRDFQEGERINGDDGESVEIPKVLKQRRLSNFVSTIMVVGLYALMVLKPGYL